jgi:xanthine dehydrogenase accessory factor
MTAQLARDVQVLFQGHWLRPLRYNWPRAVCGLLERGETAVVRVLIAEVRGSAPREPGACMLVSRSGIDGTIGGGHLEWQAIEAAQALLATARPTSLVRLRRLVLGRELAQCCGGVVQLWLERFTPADLPLLRQAAESWAGATPAAILTELTSAGVFRSLTERGSQQWRVMQARLHQPPPTDARHPQLIFASNGEENALLYEPLGSVGTALWLYGAGHVGQALIRILAELPFEVTWIDSRAELIPNALPENVQPLCTATPMHTVQMAPPAARFLVMTHDHALDYALCRRILERTDLAWLGLIGSKSKGARFRSRLARDGLAPQAIRRLVCPIGVEGVASKWPAAIAVGVAAQLLQGLDVPASGRRMSLAPTPASAVFPDACQASDCAGCASRSA